MKLFIFVLLISTASIANEFPMGEVKAPWGVRVENNDQQFKLKLGTRLQAISEQTQKTQPQQETTHNFDFYIRRMRLMVDIEYIEGWKFYADIRNDEVGKEDKGEQDFNIGDAFLEKKINENMKLRLFRAKVDVSRAQTVSSARLLFINRASIADHAAQYVSHNRRAANAQLLGTFNKRYSYQLVVGDGVYSKKFFDVLDNTPTQIVSQNAMLGAKIRFSPYESAIDSKLKEAYFGQSKAISFGLGVFNTSNIVYDTGAEQKTISRSLYNLEATYHNGSFTTLIEAFRFDGEIYDITQSQRVGSSEGLVIQGEYVFDSYYAPFLRYETWNRFVQEDDTTNTGLSVGINRYLKGEKFRYGIFYTLNDFAKTFGDKKIESAQFNLMMNY